MKKSREQIRKSIHKKYRIAKDSFEFHASLSDFERGTTQAIQYLKEAKEAEEAARKCKALALKIFSKLGYCDCEYPYYKKDNEGNCVVCKKTSRELFLS